MSTNNNDNHREDAHKILQQSSGMTPSIITTINNTSPHPPPEHVQNRYVNNNNNTNTLTKNRQRTSEPYESYIEDSFVGHWEREDDDLDDDYHGRDGHQGQMNEGADEDESTLHPSTIEFDFDSFGPESFIYTPTVPKQSLVNNENTVPSSQTLSDQHDQDAGNSVQLRPQELEQPQDDKEDPQKSGALNISPSEVLVDPAQIDLRVIEPYKKVISHAGYCHHLDPGYPPPQAGESAPAIIVFSACYLPDRSRRDYNYVMDHLFLYVLSSLHELIADDYILIYLHNTQPSQPSIFTKAFSSSEAADGSSSSKTSEADVKPHQNNLPTFTWMKRCYQMIDRRLRKNLKILYLVKPTFWLKTIVVMCKPFISTKFSRKLRFIDDMESLKKCLPLDELILPASAENI